MYCIDSWPRLGALAGVLTLVACSAPRSPAPATPLAAAPLAAAARPVPAPDNIPRARNWDKKGADNEQFLKAFEWDGKELKPVFEVDFNQLKLGRAHHMKFSATATATAARTDSAVQVAAAAR